MCRPHIHEHRQSLFVPWVCRIRWEGQPARCSCGGGNSIRGGGGGKESKAAAPTAGRRVLGLGCAGGLPGDLAVDEDEDADDPVE